MKNEQEYIKVVPLKRCTDTKISAEDFFRGDDVAKLQAAKKSFEEDEPNRIKGWEYNSLLKTYSFLFYTEI